MHALQDHEWVHATDTVFSVVMLSNSNMVLIRRYQRPPILSMPMKPVAAHTASLLRKM